MLISYHLPGRTLSNDSLATIYPEWTVEKILAKTGIASRYVVGESETALDLAEMAAKKLLGTGGVGAENVDFLLLCTQSPEYKLPSTACLLHERLGLRKEAGALAFDHGCSGFIYGLSLAKGLIAGGMAKGCCW